MKNILLLIALFFAVYCKAQTNFCGFDGLREAQLKTDPGYKQQEEYQNQQIYNYITTHPVTADRTGMAVYTIPIVFHIIHQGGPENVADSTIIQSVNELNLRFQNAAPYTDATGHPVNIQFCLASVDPWGNPTTGITRDTSFHTNLADYRNISEDALLKNVNRWCPATYLNVWIIRTMGGGAGAFSAFPTTNNPGNDGIVTKYIGLSGYTMSHEAGHYFNLYHTFSDVPNCTNFNCLLDGDQVCDTPPDYTQNYSVCGGNSCSTDMNDTSGFNPFTSDQNDLPNYMDYSACLLSFSSGQVARMQIGLTLLRPSLLQSNGCGSNPGGAMPVASYTVDSSFCEGTGTLAFHSTSTNSLYTAWDFDNDGRTDAIGDSVTHTYTYPGFYSVNMIVTGYGGSDSVVHTVHVYVNPYPTYPIVNFYSGISIDPILHTKFACIGSTVTLQGDYAMAHYLWSTGDTTQSTSFIADSTRQIYLTVTDNTGHVIHNCTPFIVNVNPRLHLAEITGDDTVNCQQLVTLRLLPNPYWFPATNTWYCNGAWASANQFAVATYGSPPGNQTFWVTGNVDPNGCVTNSDTLSFYVNPPPPIILTQQGNVLKTPYHCLYTIWYRNGVALTVNDSLLTVTSNGCYYAYCVSCGYYTSDTVCITNAGILENDFSNSINIYPNPFTSQTTISFSEDQSHTLIKITDALGKEIKTIDYSGKSCTIDKGEMKEGIYFVKITDEQKNVVNRKIIIQ
ncbi:MAG: hypothetical protein JWP12_1633 [Bacteroidetes bacterium]|nr:hypothetical protein [Bacteroidota bacterium]